MLTSPPQNNNKTMHAHTHKCCALISTEEHASEKIVGEWWWKFLVALVAHLDNARLSPPLCPWWFTLAGIQDSCFLGDLVPMLECSYYSSPTPTPISFFSYCSCCDLSMTDDATQRFSEIIFFVFFNISSGLICRLPFYNTCLPLIYICSYRFHMRLR